MKGQTCHQFLLQHSASREDKSMMADWAWTSVTKALPPDNLLVLITVEIGNKRGTAFGFMRDGEWKSEALIDPMQRLWHGKRFQNHINGKRRNRMSDPIDRQAAMRAPGSPRTSSGFVLFLRSQ